MNQPIILYGEVVHGKALGRTVGMPTANLHISSGELPECGVYATIIRVNEQTYQSVTNIGRRPTVDQENHLTIETFILDFDQDIYGEKVELEVHQFLRPIQKFKNLEQVKNQVKKDVKEAKKYLDMLVAK